MPEEATVVHSLPDTLPITSIKKRLSWCQCHLSELSLRWRMEVMRSMMPHLMLLNPIPTIMISSRGNLSTKWALLWHLMDTAAINLQSNKIHKGWDKKESSIYLHSIITMDRLVQTERHLGSRPLNNLKRGSKKSQNTSESKERISWMALLQLLKYNQK